MKRRQLAVLGVLPVAGVAVAVGYLTLGPDESRGGPLQDRYDEIGWYQACGGTEAGTVWSFGEDFDNVADTAMIIDSISVETVDGLSLVGVVRAPEAAAVGGLPQFPPRAVRPRVWARVEPVEGLVLEPGEHAHIVLGFEAEQGSGEASGFVVRYELGGKHYEAVKEAAWVIRPTC
jgi:hypothetical protein